MKLRFSIRSSHILSTPKPRRCFLYSPVFLCALLLSPLQAQRNISGEVAIRQALERLDTVGSVMMIGAHPDDENTALLAYFSRGRHMRTAYLSLTRGEGGQNLIGSEQGAALGVIRTQELLSWLNDCVCLEIFLQVEDRSSPSPMGSRCWHRRHVFRSQGTNRSVWSPCNGWPANWMPSS